RPAPHRGDHPVDDAPGATRPGRPQRFPPPPDRDGLGHLAHRRQSAGEAVHRDAAPHEAGCRRPGTRDARRPADGPEVGMDAPLHPQASTTRMPADVEPAATDPDMAATPVSPASASGGGRLRWIAALAVVAVAVVVVGGAVIFLGKPGTAVALQYVPGDAL